MKQDFVQAVDDSIHEIMKEMHTALPGTIVSYQNGFASVQPAIKYNTPAGEKLDYPVLVNVPVVIARGGNAVIAVPIMPGDECLIVIAESALDSWIAGAEDTTQLRFDLTNAICIPGLTKVPIPEQEQAQATGGIVIKGNVSITGNLSVKGNITNTGSISSSGTVTGSNITA